MIQNIWSRYGTTILRVLVMGMLAISIAFLPYELWRLVLYQGKTGAIDLGQRFNELHLWFAGQPVYNQATTATYPPASYVILWPFLGWLPFALARTLWAVTDVISLGWLAYVTIRESGARTRLEAAFMGLIPLSMYATAFTIGGGRLILFQLPPLVVGLLLFCRNRATWPRDLLATLLVLLAFVKPSVAAPFFWIVLFVPGRLRPAGLVAAGYAALTLVAASIQGSGVVSLLRGWTTISGQVAKSASVSMDNSSVHTLLYSLGLEHWNFLASLVVLSILGMWIYLHRDVDVWVLLGITGLVTRFWTYHAPYDDLLMLLPMIALFRIVTRGSGRDASAIVAGVLLACTLASTLAPGGRYLLPDPLNEVYIVGQICVWLAVLAFLIYRSRRRSDRSTTSLSAARSAGGA